MLYNYSSPEKEKFQKMTESQTVMLTMTVRKLLITTVHSFFPVRYKNRNTCFN